MLPALPKLSASSPPWIRPPPACLCVRQASPALCLTEDIVHTMQKHAACGVGLGSRARRAALLALLSSRCISSMQPSCAIAYLIAFGPVQVRRLHVDAQLTGATVHFAGGSRPLVAAASTSISGPIGIARQVTAPPRLYSRVMQIGRCWQVQADTRGPAAWTASICQLLLRRHVRNSGGMWSASFKACRWTVVRAEVCRRRSR